MNLDAPPAFSLKKTVIAVSPRDIHQIETALQYQRDRTMPPSQRCQTQQCHHQHSHSNHSLCPSRNEAENVDGEDSFLSFFRVEKKQEEQGKYPPEEHCCCVGSSSLCHQDFLGDFQCINHFLFRDDHTAVINNSGEMLMETQPRPSFMVLPRSGPQQGSSSCGRNVFLSGIEKSTLNGNKQRHHKAICIQNTVSRLTDSSNYTGVSRNPPRGRYSTHTRRERFRPPSTPYEETLRSPRDDCPQRLKRMEKGWTV